MSQISSRRDLLRYGAAAGVAAALGPAWLRRSSSWARTFAHGPRL